MRRAAGQCLELKVQALGSWRTMSATGGRVSFFFFAAALLLLAASTKTQAQGISFDAASSANTGVLSAATLTWSHTVGAAGANRILIVGVSIRNSASQTVSAVTYAGTNLTLVGAYSNSTNARVEMWRLVAPATGTNNIVITLSATAFFVGGAASFTGVNQTSPVGTFVGNSASSNTASVAVTGVTQGELVIDTLAFRNITAVYAYPTVGAGQTANWNSRTLSGTSNNNTPGAGSTEPAPSGGGTVTMSWAVADVGVTRNWALGAVALKPLPPNIVLTKNVSPTGTVSPGTDLTYTVNFSNTGGVGATALVITDPVPGNTDFKVGSATTNLGTTGLTVTNTYSNNNGTTYAYTPVSAGGGAPAGYDRAVTHVRWTFSNTLSQTAPNNAGSVSFIVRIH